MAGFKGDFVPDLPETLVYLLGMDVQTRRVILDDNRGQQLRKYLVYRGTLRNGCTVVVLWRDTAGWTEDDYRRDYDFVKQELVEGADEIYVNGDSRIPGALSLDSVIFQACVLSPVLKRTLKTRGRE